MKERESKNVVTATIEAFTTNSFEVWIYSLCCANGSRIVCVSGKNDNGHM